MRLALPSRLLIAATLVGHAFSVEPPPPAAQAGGFVAEAPFAKGWPTPKEPGVVDDAQIPAFRAVEHQDFMVLFGHISRNKIPMTAPVTYPLAQPAAGDASAQRGRRFLMPAPDTATGEIPAGARLVDAPAQRVLRMCFRGGLNVEAIQQTLELLTREAATRGLVAAGAPFLAGYNNPMRPESEQTYEVHVPVRAPEAGSPAPTKP